MFNSEAWLKHGVEFAMEILQESTVEFVTDYLFETNTKKENFLVNLTRETQIILVYNKMSGMASKKKLIRLNYDKWKRTPKSQCQFALNTGVCKK